MSGAPEPTQLGGAQPDPMPPSPPRRAGNLDDAASRAPMHARDQVPRFVLRGQEWFYRWLPHESRLMLSLVIVVLAVVAAILLSSSRILRFILDGLDVVAIIGLFLVNWLGNGGALVPIPGARFIGLLLIFNQAVILPSWEVFVTAGAAMSLGLVSYYLAGVRTAHSYAEGDDAGAEDLAQDTGMLDDEARDFMPGAEIDAEAVSVMAGVDSPASSGEDGSEPDSKGGLRGRFTSRLRQTQERAQPVIERRGAMGMFLLCFPPTPLSTAGAYVGGLMRFGFKRYLLASFAAKFLLAGVVVLLALVFSSTAASVEIPELTIPVVNITLFDDGPPASPGPSATPTPGG